LHIASHFVFDGNRPARSRLYLGDGEQLTLAQLNQTDWSFSRKQLVTLSACDSGVGTMDQARGSEIEGLAALIVRKGAQSALMTYWKIADNSTPLLMRQFYAGLTAGKNKAQALRHAQLTLMQSPSTSHPFHWAGFMVAGNWR
jgi:CHAT domain-containing protein